MINSFIIVKLTTSLKGYAILDPYVFQAHTLPHMRPHTRI